MRAVSRNIEINVLVLAEGNERLWSYRDLFYGIREKKPYRIEVTLTKFLSTFVNVASFLQGGVDLFCFMKQTEDEVLNILQELAKEQERACLLLYEKGYLFWEYYQEKGKTGAGCLAVRDKEELCNVIEKLCDYLVEVRQSSISE